MLPSAAAASSVSSAIAITPAWLRSIDAVYALFEDSQLRQKHAELADKVQNAVKLCEDVVKELGLQHCALSFNGGKDCTVIVHILAAVLRRLYGYSEPAAPGIDHQGPPISGPPSSASSSSSSSLVPIPSVYITCPSPFPVLESFIRASQIRYNLDLYTVQGGMKEGLIEYFDGGGQEGVPPVEKREKNRVAEQQSTGHKTNRTVPGRKQRSVTAIFIGTRRTDPGGDSLEPRKWTDPSWPSVERVHPILDWSYADVWAFLRCPALGSDTGTANIQDEQLPISNLNAREGFQQQATVEEEHGTAGGNKNGVPYCVLYDQGYTSLGSTFNTFPNPLLQSALNVFNPAWQLQDASSERAGRGDKTSS